MRDLLPVRVLRHRSLAGGAARRSRFVRIGAVVYLLIVRFAMRAKANAACADLPTFGCHRDRGLARSSSPRLSQHPHSGSAAKNVSIGGIFLPSRN